MEKKRVITLYKGLNEPYITSLLKGAQESPEERYVKFFELKRKFDYFMGLGKESTNKRTITIRKAEWI
jgi:hypothetical protein